MCLDLPFCGSAPGDWRTRAYLNQIATTGVMPCPEHPGTLLRLDTSTGRIEVSVDLNGLAGVFRHHSERGLLLASSPDLIAALRPCTVDDVTIWQRLISGYVSSPYTHYHEVRELVSGRHHVLQGAAHDECQWWFAPAHDPKMPLEELGERVEAAVLATLEQIARTVGRRGYLTLSAGLDSRFVAALCQQTGVLDLQGVGFATGDTVNRRASEQVARALGMPYRPVTRPADFYTRLSLSDPLILPNLFSMTDAHFHDKALGEDVCGFLLGGYRADTILVWQDTLSGRRRHLINAGRFPETLRGWAGNEIIAQCPPDVAAEIDERVARVHRDVGMSDDHPAVFRRALLLGRSSDELHYQAARRSYPIYEPFLTRRMADLAYAMPVPALLEKAKALGVPPKTLIYDRRLKDLAHIPVNPASAPAYREMVAAMTRVLPPDMLARNIVDPGEFSAQDGPLAPKFDAALEDARDMLQARLNLRLPARRGNPSAAPTRTACPICRTAPPA
jgi:asparagine synthetase B (glutamine-hydrolysing)